MFALRHVPFLFNDRRSGLKKDGDRRSAIKKSRPLLGQAIFRRLRDTPVGCGSPRVLNPRYSGAQGSVNSPHGVRVLPQESEGMKEVWIEFIRQLPAILSGLAALALAYKGLSDKLDGYHAAVNGKMDKLLETTDAAANLQGRSDLIAEQKADTRQKE